MKPIRFFLFLFFLYIATPVRVTGQVAIGPGGSSPPSSAALDVNFSNKGLLLPRVALSAANLPDPVAAPAAGLLVYNTATAGTAPQNVKPGFYVWDGSRWDPLSIPSGNAAGNMLSWDNGWQLVMPGYPGQKLTLSQDTGVVWSGSFFPVLITSPVTDITQSTATCGGEITLNGGTVVTMHGVCWNLFGMPTTADAHTLDYFGSDTFTGSLTGLQPATTYYVRAYATNATGTGYGNQRMFKTSDILPEVITSTLANITLTSAQCGGEVISQGAAPVTARGVCWSTGSGPTIADSHTVDGSGTGSFTSFLTGLTDNTLYFVRAYASNSAGTAYGQEVTFTTAGTGFGTPCPGIETITYGSRTYNTVQIGTQCWLKENLDIGTMISLGTGQANNAVVEKYCYNNKDSLCNIYGGLYQWAEAVQYLNGATNTDSWNPVPMGNVRGICPEGWHLPSNTEWNTLFTWLGGSGIAGGKMKEPENYHWAAPNTGATNSSGFTTLPGGICSTFFDYLSYRAFYLSATEQNASYNYSIELGHDVETANLFFDSKTAGRSVRCIKD